MLLDIVVDSSVSRAWAKILAGAVALGVLAFLFLRHRRSASK